MNHTRTYVCIMAIVHVVYVYVHAYDDYISKTTHGDFEMANRRAGLRTKTTAFWSTDARIALGCFGWVHVLQKQDLSISLR